MSVTISVGLADRKAAISFSVSIAGSYLLIIKLGSLCRETCWSLMFEKKQVRKAGQKKQKLEDDFYIQKL